ncbi:hypothetical protein DTO013E5_5138 [Penicillium roqueforti]|uniref:Genomic scaffold, ProqFM164S01 n=1 Tax=Penicillium roqueforti (strain FM164) TaxID=1365484 RepID=W6PZQ8_PENRF|nr:uncharacterized protein LCP9604111_5613 [Penicillium roqueforti]CDM29535.1 unnamed protein product [Penicillium roqueforti FM164]KAF9248358.1 hypothetical protein LCP9604111_5613 [Penicillium roqueforti]KAI1836216.1 hypothetical protein CBS147337_3365 [Penicillium roqueforti]KAI2679991.1 hypothetical protein LCP963914a_7081 [Penicillium roqueforti]KAI2683239.1 hypothetical protein CBS147355_2379 [Penicillium roqueforti]
MPSITATGDFGPAPAGVDLAKNQTGNLLGAVIPVAVFGTIAVILRLVAPMKNKEARKLALDDYLIVAALIFSWGTAISCFISIPYGNGYHLQSLNKAEFITVWKILFAYVMIYATAITFTKSSIVFFYGRIFNFRWSLGFCMFLVLGYWVTIIVTVAVACRPLPYFWLAYTDPTAVGVCIDVPKFFFGNGIAAMLIDVIILCMPMPTIYKLQMQSSQKLAVVGILLLGSFVCVASICRIISLQNNTHGTDATWTMAPVFIWSSVEPFVGIICACLPTFGPFFRRWWSKARTGRSSNSRNTPSGENASASPSTTWLRKPRAKKPPMDSLFSINEFSCVDEVELMNDISGPRSLRDEAVSDHHDVERGDPCAITVHQEVDVTWDKYKTRK